MLYNKFDDKTKFFFLHDRDIVHTEASVGNAHYHNRFEIYFITKGTATYFIDNKTYELEKGDIILIPEGVIHNTKYGTNMYSRMLINCSHRYIPASVRPSLSSMLYLYRNPAISDEVYDLFLKIEKEYNNRDCHTDDILSCYTNMLFFLLERNKDGCIHVDTRNQCIEEAIEFLQGNFAENITLSELAHRFSMSPEHFSRTFKKETGFGFSKYLNLLRLQKAEIIIKQNEQASITQIAEECGFEDSNYFSVKFKEMYGISPKKLQKSLRAR